jgi:AAA+ ATPase superfamily predicted ATPase
MEVATLKDKTTGAILSLYMHFLEKQGYKVIDETKPGTMKGGEKPFFQMMLEAFLGAIIVYITIVITQQVNKPEDLFKVLDDVISNPNEIVIKLTEEHSKELNDVKERVVNTSIGSDTTLKLETKISTDIVEKNINHVLEKISNKQKFSEALADMIYMFGKMGGETYRRIDDSEVVNQLTQYREDKLNYKGADFGFDDVYGKRPSKSPLSKLSSVVKATREIPAIVDNTGDVRYGDIYKRKGNLGENEIISDPNIVELSIKKSNPLYKTRRLRTLVDEPVKEDLVGMPSEEFKEGGAKKRREKSKRKRGGSKKQKRRSHKRK